METTKITHKHSAADLVILYVSLVIRMFLLVVTWHIGTHIFESYPTLSHFIHAITLTAGLWITRTYLHEQW